MIAPGGCATIGCWWQGVNDIMNVVVFPNYNITLWGLCVFLFITYIAFEFASWVIGAVGGGGTNPNDFPEDTESQFDMDKYQRFTERQEKMDQVRAKYNSGRKSGSPRW